MGKLKVGVQLFSVRDEMEKDLNGTLQKIKNMGYDYVEFAGYFGRSAEEIRGMLNNIGLSCISVHQSHDVFLNDAEKEITYLKKIGTSYSAIPWVDPARFSGEEHFSALLNEIHRVGKTLKEAGIQLLYHNHDFEFGCDSSNRIYLDRLYAETPVDILQCEIDTCWVRYTNNDPAAYLLKYAGRSPVVHLKDFVLDKENGGIHFCPVGQGIQNFPEIIKAAEKAGAEYVIVEQDCTYEQNCLEAVQQSREYLRSLGL